MAGYGLHMRHPRVHVPVFPDSSLPLCQVSLKTGQSTYNALAVGALQRMLRSRFRARLKLRVAMTSNVKSWQQIF